ncbi:RNA exonuclease 1 [Portunus trituberculatus]|uniref:RNA exonuclease 1 n=1 Tax=Portunus trituberculatus TaxID=210409 RepID=A0A5B7H6H4_PORTR|nr:RNA exonuclease 1 [Portunus trituberculatus]
MLPSSGYFRGIACPGQLKGACNRPYCHFRHDMKVRKATVKNTKYSVELKKTQTLPIQPTTMSPRT